MSLDAYLDACGYGTAFREDHLYPMAAAIWSTPAAEIGEYPARAFIRFCENHGLLKLTNRPLWRTLAGGSRAYVEKLAKAIPEILNQHARSAVRRHRDGVEIVSREGEIRRFDQIVLATHADQALATARRPDCRGEAAAWRFRLLRQQRRAPFRRDPHAASTPRLVKLELSVERPGNSRRLGGQLLDEPSSRAAKREADVFDFERAPANPRGINPVRD